MKWPYGWVERVIEMVLSAVAGRHIRVLPARETSPGHWDATPDAE